MIEETIRAHYPKAETGAHITQTYLEYLSDHYNEDLKKMLFATSVCADDINVSTDFRRVLSRPFTLGGLGGIPFAGFTGMVAYAHHVPDGGSAFIFYGPHIGITDDGELGKMHRPGQKRLSNSCGALMLALSRLEAEDDIYVPTNVEYDYQQILLERTAMPYKHEILVAKNRKKAITDVTYKNIDRQLHFLIRKAKNEFTCKRIFLLGGVIINTSPGQHDYVEVRNFEAIDFHDMEPITSESIMDQPAFKAL
ncbi:MAG: hypothetical protein EAY75_10980 [Bacteroidetes bacterium]|nr:MAG: hypothetical protein EAY75_10980 [Bacteroidota bacterium]